MSKKLFFVLLVLFGITLSLSAQTHDNQQKSTSVTKFLGIPIDGTKKEMIQKLINKGYEYDSNYDCLEGEFNGYKVKLHVVTNNNKVYRILVEDARYISETDIKIRFNRLCKQFSNNERYISLKNYEIPDEEDISYEITVHNKRYEASYYQTEKLTDTLAIKKEMQELVYNKYGKDKNIEDLTDSETIEITLDYLLFYIEKYTNNSVWFMIDDGYAGYKILMYYDNLNNQANGEDL